MSDSPEGRLWELMRGALTARVLGLVADLRVADVLAEGPRPVAELARETGADEDLLHRSLRALASDGVFAADEPGVFRNNAASELLRGGTGWDDFAHFFGGVWFRAIGELDASGEPTFPRLFGADFWSWLAEHPDERAAFDRAMEQGKERRVERLAALEWHGGETIVDVGGGNGSLMRELLQRRPDLRAIVFDLPETVRDESTLRRPDGIRRRQLLRVRSTRRRLCPLDDPPRLGRPERGGDPAHDSRRGTGRRAADPHRGRCRAGQRAGRREVARPADARAVRRA